MECDLPCENAFFNAEHPFAQPNFRFSREITVYDAFQFLFAEDQPINPSSSGASAVKFTVLDMFILIHRMYSSDSIVVQYSTN